MAMRGKNPLYTQPTVVGDGAVSSVWDGGPGRQLSTISYSGSLFLYRPLCCDIHTLVDVAKRRYYERYRKVQSGDVWLDAGANIGAFSVLASKVASRVVAVEPEPSNFDILEKNLKLNGCTNVTTIQAALVPDDTESVTLYQNITGNTGSHSLFVKRGRPSLEVAAVNAAALVEAHGVDCVKADIEGAEREIVPTLPLDSLKALVMEYHFNACRDKDHSGYHNLVALLSKSFPNMRYNPDPSFTSWYALIHCWR